MSVLTIEKTLSVDEELIKLGYEKNEINQIKNKIEEKIKYQKSKSFSIGNFGFDYEGTLKEILNDIRIERGNANLKKHNFNESAVMGQLGVIILTHYLLVSNICKKIINLDNDLNQQFDGYDLILTLNTTHNPTPEALRLQKIFNKNEIKVEVKTDAQDHTGNIALEMYSNYDSGRKGWAFTSKSDLIFYFFINTHKLFVFETRKLQGFSHFLNNLLDPLRNQFNAYHNISSNDMSGLDILFYPRNCSIPFERTDYGFKNLSNGGIYSPYDKFGKLKKYLSKRFMLVDFDCFFSCFGSHLPENLVRRYNYQKTSLFSSFKLTYVKASNVGNNRRFYSLCLLVPITFLRDMNLFLFEPALQKEESLELEKGFKFVRGGGVEKYVRNGLPIKKNFTQENYSLMMNTFKKKLIQQGFNSNQIAESFLI